MGSEFLKRTKPSIKKNIDAKRVELSSTDLLTRIPENQPRCLLASIVSGAALKNGEDLIIEAKDEGLSASRGNTVVANIDKPPTTIFSAVKECGGVAAGVVRHVHKLSNTAELFLC